MGGYKIRTDFQILDGREASAFLAAFAAARRPRSGWRARCILTERSM
jgi:hypothetical protein